MKKLLFAALLLLTGGILSTQWTKLQSFTTNDLLDCDFPDPGLGVVCGTGGMVCLTTDAGSSWKNISPARGMNFTSVEVESSKTFYVSGYENHPEGGGIDWEQVYTGKDTLNALCMTSEKDGYVVTGLPDL